MAAFISKTKEQVTTALSNLSSSDKPAEDNAHKSEKIKSPIEEKLEGFFKEGAEGRKEEKKELESKNILKDDRIAPALQAKQEELKRAQLEDSLDSAISRRPKPEELIKEGILQPDENPTAE